MADHPTIAIKHPKSGLNIKIDEVIAPLITKLWELDIDTSFCCQGDVLEGSKSYRDSEWDRAYISFPDFKNFSAFMDKISYFNEVHEVEECSDIFENYPSTLFDRLYRCPLNKWEFDVNPKWEDGKQRIMSSVYFPSHDIHEMLAVLEDGYKPGYYSVDGEPVIIEASQCTNYLDGEEVIF